MRHLVSPTIAIALSIVTAAAATAQTSRSDRRGRGTNTRSHAERTARASWTPVRGNERTVALPARQSDSDRRDAGSNDRRQGRVAPVALVDYTTTSAGHSRQHVIEPPVVRGASGPVSMPPTMAGSRVVGSSIVNAPMNGQVVTHSGPIHSGAGHSSAVHSGAIHGGPIVFEAIVSSSACDALPGGCGCSDSSCDGGCGMAVSCGCDGGCDSIGSGRLLQHVRRIGLAERLEALLDSVLAPRRLGIV